MLLLRLLIIKTPAAAAPPKFRVRQLFCLFCCLLVFCSLSSLVLIFNLRPNMSDFFRLPSHLELTAMAEKVQMSRRNSIEEKCQQQVKSAGNATRPVQFRIEERHRIMYCDVPKVASTNLKRLMLILSGAVDTDNLSSIPRLTVHEENPMIKLDAFNFTDVIQNQLANNLTRFIFVRHPFERLVSAYRDKLAGNNLFYQKTIGREIIQKYRQNPSGFSLENGHDVTFPEFVRFIVDQWQDGRKILDVHWRPIVDLCLPCVMRYDFIGKFETLNRDVSILLRKINRDDLNRLFTQSNEENSKKMSTLSLWKQYRNQLSHQQLSQLNGMYGDDFTIFGYLPYLGEEENEHK